MQFCANSSLLPCDNLSRLHQRHHTYGSCTYSLLLPLPIINRLLSSMQHQTCHIPNAHIINDLGQVDDTVSNHNLPVLEDFVVWHRLCAGLAISLGSPRYIIFYSIKEVAIRILRLVSWTSQARFFTRTHNITSSLLFRANRRLVYCSIVSFNV